LMGVESPLPCLADLSLRVLEDFADPFEGPVDVRTLGMVSPAPHFAHLATELSESHLDVAQPEVNGSRPAEIAPALLGLAVRLICHDEPPPRGPPTNRLPQDSHLRLGRGSLSGSGAGCGRPSQQ